MTQNVLVTFYQLLNDSELETVSSWTVPSAVDLAVYLKAHEA